MFQNLIKEQAAAQDAKKLEPVPEMKPQAMSKGHLNAFILIGVGLTKLVNMGKAIRVGDEPTKMCLHYFLDDDVCSDDGLNTFLRFKVSWEYVLAVADVKHLQVSNFRQFRSTCSVFKCW